MADTPATPLKKPTSWPRAGLVAAMLILLLGVPTYVVLSWNRSLLSMPERLFGAFGDSLRPKVEVHDLILTSIGELHHVSKLVVLKTSISADVTRDESAESWGINWGTNTARVVVKEAHVQYLIDLEGIGTSNYEYDEASKTLTLSVPAPHVDDDVSIDPGQIETVDLRGGWARWDKGDTRENAIKELVPTVIIQANSPLLKKEAREAGLEAMTNWCKPMADTLAKDGVTLKVRYREQ